MIAKCEFKKQFRKLSQTRDHGDTRTDSQDAY